MSAALPMALRVRFQEYVEEGLSGRAAAARLKLSAATERLRARVKHLRQTWFRHRISAMRAHPEWLVFIDETSVKTNLTRLRGRSLCGNRLEMDAPFGAWGTQTFIAGLTQHGLIAPWVIKGAMDGEAFEAYLHNVLAPELQPGTVVICDNLSTHYNKAAAETLRSVGCWFLFLPLPDQCDSQCLNAHLDMRIFRTRLGTVRCNQVNISKNGRVTSRRNVQPHSPVSTTSARLSGIPRRSMRTLRENGLLSTRVR